MTGKRLNTIEGVVSLVVTVVIVYTITPLPLSFHKLVRVIDDLRKDIDSLRKVINSLRKVTD